MGEEKDQHFYDEVYRTSTKYQKPPESIEYYSEVWSEAIAQIQNHVPQPKQIIDLGCGPGHFALLLASKLDDLEEYRGYDFSQVAIEMAKSRLADDSRFKFYQENLVNCDFLAKESPDVVYNLYEFLEHISFDLELLSKIPAGAWVSFSVPSYDSAGHVRWFNSLSDVKERYKKLIEIEQVYTCPVKLNSIFLCIGKKVKLNRYFDIIQKVNQYLSKWG